MKPQGLHSALDPHMFSCQQRTSKLLLKQESAPGLILGGKTCNQNVRMLQKRHPLQHSALSLKKGER